LETDPKGRRIVIIRHIEQVECSAQGSTTALRIA
jgi:hypothetical protein